MKIGRNDPCPCGSGRKYKKCHGGVSGFLPETAPKPQQRSIRERNMILIEAVVDIFGLTKGIGWEQVKKNISDDQVREVYRVVAELWPPDTDLISLLPHPDHSLRALYMGDIDPELIVRNVFRFSLYSDEIMIIDPFHNPWCMAKEYNPLVNPGQWKMDTLKLVFCAMLLAPWIEAGLVTLVPDPGHFDYPLRRKTWDLAAERYKGWSPTKEDMEDFEPSGTQQFARFVYTMPKDYLARKAREVYPNLADLEVAKVLEYFDHLRKQDPLALDQPVEQVGSQTLVARSGVNLEMGLYIAQATGAFPYTSLRARWKELLSVTEELPEAAQTWSPLTRAFQQLSFKFLNNVDSEFACSIRKDGRLADFRAFLRRLWTTVGGEPSSDKAETLARDFGDELAGEYHKAEAEWGQIDRDLVKQSGATLAGGLISGAFSLYIPNLGFALAGVIELLNARMKRREFRKKVPLSVLIDLSKHRAGS